ncbi:MAG: DNA-formamidopyrimidine glycosylase, partial [bacterium]
SITPLSPATFTKRLIGQKIKSVERRAKMLIVDLVGPDSLVFHLKMTGQVIFLPKKGKAIMGGHPEDPQKYTRIIFTFTDSDKLLFNDLRKFGWARLVDDKQIKTMTDKVGVEPLSKDFTVKVLSEFFQRYPNRTVKQILMDQALIAGIGNIYADESCFLAKILPTRKANKVKLTKITLLHKSIISVLKLSISKKGTSSKNYVRSDGSRGGFVPHLNVYGRAGLSCKVCDTPIQKIRHMQRGTHFCPHCQK